MTAPDEGKRRARTVMATDSEWARIQERAATEDLPTSRYVVQQLLQPAGEPAPPSLPIDVQWLMVRQLMMLARVEKHRFEQSGQLEAWETLEEACAAFVESEARLG
ncbi:MAG: hypothetical protein OXQ84_17145 [bacterium]|nr:hypothetical protein [bacterium]